jgi:hypothetical protein
LTFGQAAVSKVLVGTVAKQNALTGRSSTRSRWLRRRTDGSGVTQRKLLAGNNGGTAGPSVCAAFPDGCGIASASGTNVSHLLRVRTDTETAPLNWLNVVIMTTSGEGGTTFEKGPLGPGPPADQESSLMCLTERFSEL